MNTKSKKNIIFILFVLSSPFLFKGCYQSFKYTSLQAEIAASLADYVKASQAYYTEYGTIAKSSKDLGEYVDINGCQINDPDFCKSNSENFSKSNKTKWFSSTGNYEIKMQRFGHALFFIANPTGEIQKQGKGGWGLYDSCAGSYKTELLSERGKVNVKNIVEVNTTTKCWHTKETPNFEKEYLLCLKRAKSMLNKSLKDTQMSECEIKRADEMIKQMQKANER